MPFTKTRRDCWNITSIFTACSAWALSRLKRCPFVFEIRDIWPASAVAVKLQISNLLLLPAEKVADFLYKQAALLIVVTESSKQYLCHKGIAGKKICVVENGTNLDFFKGACDEGENLREVLGLTDKFIAGYVGTHGMAHALETIVEAARIANSTDGMDDFHFVTIGSGAMFDAVQQQAKGLDNFIMLGQVEHEAILRYWHMLDCSIIHLRKASLFEKVIPSKLFESLASGKPVLHGVPGESAEIVKRLNVGICFEPEDPYSLIEKLCDLSAHKQQYDEFCDNCFKAAKQYDRTKLASAMFAHLIDLKK